MNLLFRKMSDDEEWQDGNSKKRKTPSKKREPAVKLGSGSVLFMVTRSSLDENDHEDTDYWLFSTKLKGLKFAVSLVEWEFEGKRGKKEQESEETFFETQLELATEDRDAMEAYVGDHLLEWMSISCSPIKLDSKKSK
jgi:hypothetical protein